MPVGEEKNTRVRQIVELVHRLAADTTRCSFLITVQQPRDTEALQIASIMMAHSGY